MARATWPHLAHAERAVLSTTTFGSTARGGMRVACGTYGGGEGNGLVDQAHHTYVLHSYCTRGKLRARYSRLNSRGGQGRKERGFVSRRLQHVSPRPCVTSLHAEM